MQHGLAHASESSKVLAIVEVLNAHKYGAGFRLSVHRVLMLKTAESGYNNNLSLEHKMSSQNQPKIFISLLPLYKSVC